MCESTAYVVEGGAESLFLKDVVKITPQDEGKLLVESLLGDQKVFDGKIAQIDFMGHKILLAKE